MSIRRRNNRIWFVALGVFVAVFLFVFLMQRFKGGDEVNAASLAGFDPGYIISDWQMGNYNSMSEVQIQNFLTSKNSCENRDYNYYLALSANKNYTWHWANGHFVCLSEERFGDGEVIGSGDTAAHIIWRAAQDYRINPQVLLVLLQKETGLITDPIPNNGDYRKATGYGCPDTAPCSSQYFGFKNQVRKAAALFRTVLDGGWTNYPLGNNYVQYNPNAACGGSVVNIRSLATSALYRYTPYQPNAGALAAGYGIASCGAYGNRNFYLYFEDWFGGITGEGYSSMDSPRYMTNKDTGEIRYYTIKRILSGELCLNDDSYSGSCVPYSKLMNTIWDWQDMLTSRYLKGSDSATKINLTESNTNTNLVNRTIYYNKKAILPDGRQCLLPEDTSKYSGWCAVFDTLEEVDFEEQAMQTPRLMEAVKNTYFIEPVTKNKLSFVAMGSKYSFSKKVFLPDVGMCLLVAGQSGCILYDDLREAWHEMEYKREFSVNNDMYKIDVSSGGYDKSVLMNRGMVRRFVSKIYYQDEWCLRTEYDDARGNAKCSPMSMLSENWITLNGTKEMTILANSQKIDAINMDAGLRLEKSEKRVFTAKYYIASRGQWCYRTEYDTNLSTNYCFLEKDLK